MRRVAVVPVVLTAVLAVAGCSSSGSGKNTTSSPAPSATAAATVAPSVLTGKLRSLTSLTSVHFTAATDVSGQKITGTGTARLADGAILAGDLTQALPGGLGDIRVVRAGGKTYAKLPAGLSKTQKPWLLLDAASTNPIASQLATVVSTILAVASPSSLVAFANAATSIRDLGGGRYALQVDAAKLPPDLSAGLGKTGTVPVQLTLDGQNRPTRIAGTFSVAGAPVSPVITLSDFNAPVSIVAPPASQVGSK